MALTIGSEGKTLLFKMDLGWTCVLPLASSSLARVKAVCKGIVREKNRLPPCHT